jgi:hypothetical protein
MHHNPELVFVTADCSSSSIVAVVELSSFAIVGFLDLSEHNERKTFIATSSNSSSSFKVLRNHHNQCWPFACEFCFCFHQQEHHHRRKSRASYS